MKTDYDAALEALYDVKFTFESVRPQTTVAQLVDLYEKVCDILARIECRPPKADGISHADYQSVDHARLAWLRDCCRDAW